LSLRQQRVAPTEKIGITNAFLLTTSGVRLTSVSPDHQVYVHADFSAQGWPSDASYEIAYAVTGLKMHFKNFGHDTGESKIGSRREILGYDIVTFGEAPSARPGSARARHSG
jgi:hypothetical protein